MLKKCSIGFVLLSSLYTSFTFAESPPLPKQSTIAPFKAEYDIIRKSDVVGTGERQLKFLDDGTAEYSYHTNIEWFIFSDTRTENSVIKIKNGTVIPQSYQYTREGTGRDKFYNWRFFPEKNQAENLVEKKTIDIDFSAGLQDTLSYHLQQRLNLINNPKQEQFVYSVIGLSGQLKHYVYQYDGEEELMLPYGLVKTIRLKREVTSKKRVTYAWFSPKLDYLLVKLHQIKGGVEQFQAHLTKVTLPETEAKTSK